MKQPVQVSLLSLVCLLLLAGLLTNCTPGGAAGPEAVVTVSVDRPEAGPTAEPIMEEVGPMPTGLPLVETLAYVQNGTLYISLNGGTPLAVESCPAGAYCFLQYLKWSPDGQHLLYYFYDGTEDSLRIADQQGQVQVVTDNSNYVMPGDWSPDGQAVVFLRPTESYIEGDESTPPVHVHEVWTAVLDETGTVQEPQLVGQTNRMPDGCGGGGRSPSEVLYENEGGTAYGYLMAVLEWTTADVLLYTQNCGNVGLNRFDMSSGSDLPPFDQPLRNLVLDASGERWYAVTGHTWSQEPGDHQLATGLVTETAVTLIPTANPVELVFYGPVSHKLYYTTRELVETAELPEQGAYFQFHQPALWQINSDGSEESLLWQDEADQAYAQVMEFANGDVLLVRVESDRPLYEALQSGAATVDEMGEFEPQRHILRLVAGGELQVVIGSAGQPELAP